MYFSCYVLLCEKCKIFKMKCNANISVRYEPNDNFRKCFYSLMQICMSKDYNCSNRYFSFSKIHRVVVKFKKVAVIC